MTTLTLCRTNPKSGLIYADRDRTTLTLTRMRRGLKYHPTYQFYATGATTLLNNFIDYYATPPGDPNPPKPKFDVTASPADLSN